MTTKLRDADDRLSTIRSLLAKAEATEFLDEADAFNAKASELMARYAIDEAMVWASAPPDPSDVVEVEFEIHPPFVSQKLLLICGVAEAQGCMALQLRGAVGTRPGVVSILGLGGAVASVEALATSLLVQMSSSMTRADAARATDVRTPRTASETAAWRRSFIVGFGGAIITRLREQRQAIVDAARNEDANSTGPSTALAVARQESHVRDEFTRRYPYVRTKRISAGWSPAGREAGVSAGERADLGGPRLGGRTALPR